MDTGVFCGFYGVAMWFQECCYVDTGVFWGFYGVMIARMFCRLAVIVSVDGDTVVKAHHGLCHLLNAACRTTVAPQIRFHLSREESEVRRARRRRRISF